MTAEIRITRKGIIFFLLVNIILMYMISGRGCKNNNGNADIHQLQQQNNDDVNIQQQPVRAMEERLRYEGQGQEQQQKLPDQTIEIQEKDLPIIYGITPTYARPLQKAELTR